MKLWLASYPRSGNTLIRLILNQAFGIKSTSLYPSEDKSMTDQPDWFRDKIGYAGPLDQVSGEEWIGVKTHGLPTDDGPAIYVVRDGRAALASYFHLLRDFSTAKPMTAIIEGDVWVGPWSDHIAAWRDRPRTLMLRYEDLTSDPEQQFKDISEFLGVPQIAPFEQTFEELHRFNPKLFRTANNERNIAELTPHMDLFMERHGAMMRDLGYVED